MSILMSPEEVWKDVEIESEDFDESVLKEYETEDAKYREVYFNGKKTNAGITRIYAVIALPKSVQNPPVVLLCHDFNNSIDKSYIDYFIKMNFAVMMCDMYGHYEGRKYTFYPDDIKYANIDSAENHIFEVDNSARETLPFEWTMVNRYALKYLRTQKDVDYSKIACVGIGEGATVTWQLAYVEKELKACVALFYAGWGEYGKNYKFASDSEITNLTSNRVAYIAGVSPQSYAPYVNVPMLYLTASNNQLGNLDRAFDTMARINGAVTSIIAITPNSINRIGYFA
ncbi:MAG: dienelactone hydrolase family protein, partial [Clostridia bacterium]